MAEYLVVALLGLVALGAVAYPFLVGYARYDSNAQLEHDIQRYRDALAARTLCSRCRFANPPDSRFCTDCGRELGG